MKDQMSVSEIYTLLNGENSFIFKYKMLGKTAAVKILYIIYKYFRKQGVSAVGVVVSCKIPILATRVRFPDGACFFLLNRI